MTEGDCVTLTQHLSDFKQIFFRYAFSLTAFGDSVSLRLGHATALTPHCGVIHYRVATSLPPGGSLIVKFIVHHTPEGNWLLKKAPRRKARRGA